MKPCKIDPNKATHVDKLHMCMHSPDFIWEEKLDGINLMSIGGRLYSNVVSKVTGWPSEKTGHVPHISTPLKEVSSLLILDGEAYIPGWKSNQVSSIMGTKDPGQAVVKQIAKGNLQYWVYDILRDVDGTWLINTPFIERRKILEQRFQEHFQHNSDIILNDMFECTVRDPQEAFDDIIAQGLEGIVLKSKQGRYVPGGRPMWNQIKLKANLTDDVVIMGFNEPTKKYDGKNVEEWPYWENDIPVTKHYALGLVGSIIIGKYDADGQLVPVGNITGITDSLRQAFSEHPDDYINRVIKIKAMEKTDDNKYRHANFVAFHDDKNANECTLLDQVG